MKFKFTAGEAELDLVRTALRIEADTAPRYSKLMPEIHCRPLPFFGPIACARVITFGLNPSTAEFTKGNWSRERFPDAALANQLVNYWTNPQRTAHKWFKPWQTVLSELGVSYESDAAHIDLSPRATNCRKGELKPLFIEMLQTDAEIWIKALRSAPKCELILAAGAATNGCFIDQFISKMPTEKGVRLLGDCRRTGSGPGQTAEHRLELSAENREIPFFFCSTSPSSPKDKEGKVLIDACRKKMDCLRAHLSASR